MTAWIRKAFESHGLTQYPVGPHLSRIQERFGGAVVLCLDVSGSMWVQPLAQAVAGCERFIDEALAGGYSVEMLLWHQGIAGHTQLSRDRDELVQFLNTARSGGGNDIVPTLEHADSVLADLSGDRVVAIFGDGDLGSQSAAESAARQLTAKGIRIITCGLGLASASTLAEISTEGPDDVRVAGQDSIADSVAGMASGLRRAR